LFCEISCRKIASDDAFASAFLFAIRLHIHSFAITLISNRHNNIFFLNQIFFMNFFDIFQNRGIYGALVFPFLLEYPVDHDWCKICKKLFWVT